MQKPRIEFDLDPIEEAALDMLLADLNNNDPGANWDRGSLAKSILRQVLEEDFALHAGAVTAH